MASPEYRLTILLLERVNKSPSPKPQKGVRNKANQETRSAGETNARVNDIISSTGIRVPSGVMSWASQSRFAICRAGIMCLK